jgi:hypothetical protein
MVSIGAFVLLALATPYVAVVIFSVVFAFGTDPPWYVTAGLALALAAPGVGGVVLFDPPALDDALAGILLTLLGGVGVIHPELLSTNYERSLLRGSRLRRYRRETTDDDHPAAPIVLRVITVVVLLVGLYLTADALLATPDQRQFYPHVH